MATLAPMARARTAPAPTCEAPAPGQAADRIAHVAHEHIEPSPDPRVPHGFLHLGHAAELEARLSPGFGLAQSVLDQVLDAAVHVIPQFAIEVPFQPVAPPPEEIEESATAQAPSLKISRTAAANCFQVAFSRASCLRPARVSE